MDFYPDFGPKTAPKRDQKVSENHKNSIVCRQVVILAPFGCFGGPFLLAWAPFLASLWPLGMFFVAKLC